uniref:acyl-CoA-binding protein-like isoform X1 n=1 Tax=Fragaria vesca subsp. vesca TaxID=101020 RepID=UPI0005C8B789|nr:PREDICTED: acyl-CoA-binding protein-like isoform X1 [Fragaria vesca subsp. vesca]
MAQALQEEFKEYAEKAKSLPSTTKDADKLVLYGLYKQATVGSVSTNRPGFFSPTERAKWDAWKAVEGTKPSNPTWLIIQNPSYNPSSSFFLFLRYSVCVINLMCM